MLDKVREPGSSFHTRESLTVCLVSETFPPETNGVAMTLGRLADGLVDAGHAVQLITPFRRDRSIAAYPRVKARYVAGMPIPGYTSMRMGFPAGGAMAALWRREHLPDVLYVATQGLLGLSALKEAQRRRIPVVSGFHTNFQQYSKHYRVGWLEPAITRYFRYFHNRTAATLVPTESQAAVVRRFGITNPRTLGRGVDADLFHPCKRSEDLRRALGFDPQDPLLLYVGRLAGEKNIDLAVRAAQRARETAPRARLVLVGDGPDGARLEREYPDLIFYGERHGEALAQIYASGDVFVFPSASETFGNVTLEAMASGLPVVVFDYAAARIAVRTGENGIAVPLGREDAFVDEVVKLAADSNLRHRLGASARITAEKFRWQAIVAEFETQLREAMSVQTQ